MILNSNIVRKQNYYSGILSGLFFVISCLFVNDSQLSIPILMISLAIIGIWSKNTFYLISWEVLLFYSVWIYNDESAFKLSIPFQLCYILLFSKAKFKLDKGDIILICITIWTSISFLYNELVLSNPIILNSLEKGYVNFVIIILFFILNKQNNISTDNILKLFVLFVFTLSFVPLFEEKTLVSNNDIARISGLADVNTFCKFSALALYFNLNKEFFNYRLKTAISVTLVFATLLTFSKMGFILLLLIFMPYYKLFLRIKVLVPLFVVVLVIIMFIHKLEKQNIDFGNFIENRILPERNDNSTINRLSSDRTYIWESTLSYWTKYPSTYIIGQGIGTMGMRNINVFDTDKAIHNTILELFFEIGVVGVFLYLNYLILLLRGLNWRLKLLIIIPLLFLSGPFRYDMFLVFVLIYFYKKNIEHNQEENVVKSSGS